MAKLDSLFINPPWGGDAKNNDTMEMVRWMYADGFAKLFKKMAAQLDDAIVARDIVDIRLYLKIISDLISDSKIDYVMEELEKYRRSLDEEIA